MRLKCLLSSLLSCTFLPFALAACGGLPEAGEGGEGGGRGGASVSSTTCASGSVWTGGNEGSALMKPGANCISCHASSGEGPRYMSAGTVYSAANEAVDCNGVDGVEVVLEDANGTVVRMGTNTAGNFYRSGTSSSLVSPIYVRVEGPGGTNAMASEVTDLNCMNCHTTLGANGAPGRILAP